jgi:tRNA-Thr(GGU) m(6)t(6)A37 methyltransferase TsaA
MSIIDWLKSVSSGPPPEIPDEPATYRPIGVVSNRVKESRTEGWNDVKSDIILRPELAPALESIDGFSHLIVVFHMHRIPSAEARSSVAVSGTSRGVLATRSQLRPNPIGVAVVTLVERRENVLRVQGLDALDGSPVLDIKPYLPPYDSIASSHLPAWAVGAELD